MRGHLVVVAAAGISALLISMLSSGALGGSSPHQLAGDRPLALTGDGTPQVRRMATAVVRAVLEHEVVAAPAELEIRSVDGVETDGFVGGHTEGRLILVSRNVALPERTLLHEFAHAVVGGSRGTVAQPLHHRGPRGVR